MQKVLALIAHDQKKKEMIDFCTKWQPKLSRISLIATGCTGDRIAQATGLPVECVLPGRNGGDIQIASRVASGEIHGVVLLFDPQRPGVHEPDIGPLLRICGLHNTPLALNLATAELLVKSMV
jgi:methylglyoxal synthase